MTRRQKIKALIKAKIKAKRLLDDVDNGLREPTAAYVLWALCNEQIQSLEKDLAQ